MKSPLLILFIVCNLLAVNMALAINMYDAETGESHLQQVHDDNATRTCIDESSCDHFCHFSAHMAGFITHITSLSTVDDAVVYTIYNEQLYSLVLTPPSQPPQA